MKTHMTPEDVMEKGLVAHTCTDLNITLPKKKLSFPQALELYINPRVLGAPPPPPTGGTFGLVPNLPGT